MFIKNFKQLDKNDVSIAGGKGASLGEMARAKFPVPPGFVILASAFDKFLLENGLDADIAAILKKVNHKDLNSVDRAANEIQEMILDAEMPEPVKTEILSAYGKLSAEFVAIRSSATAEDSKIASWAGELETYLNVKKNYVINYVIKCWASLFTPRAIFYRFEKKLHRTKTSVAVVVQKMVQSEISGICFTVHPVTKDRNQMVIEAAFGLGEAIVGGQITPDTYIIDKRTLSIMDINIGLQAFAIYKSAKGNIHKKLPAVLGNKQKLVAKQIIALAKACRKIERHYRHPQDIEWTKENNKFYIVQSRPITTL